MNHDPRCEQWYRSHVSGGGNMSWEQIASEDGMTAETVRKRVRKWRRGAPADEAVPSALPEAPHLIDGGEVKGEIVFEDKRPLPTDDDVRELLDAYLNVIEKAKPLSIRQREASVRFTGNLPIAIPFFGDGHIGSWGWAAKRQMEDIRLVAETDGVYPIFMGDDWDNFIFNFAKWASVMPPSHQRKIGHYMFKAIFPKTVAIVGGNHLEWTKKAADVDLSAELAEKSNAVFLGTRGDMTAKVGSQEYHLFLHHRARGASSVNKTNSARVAANEIGGADVIVEADRHDPWEQTSYHNRRKQVWLRTGTYKVEDEYPDEIDFEQGKWDMPMVILFPDKKKALPFMDFRDGLLTLKALREQYAKRSA